MEQESKWLNALRVRDRIESPQESAKVAGRTDGHASDRRVFEPFWDRVREFVFLCQNKCPENLRPLIVAVFRNRTEKLRDGVCRLLPTITRLLSETASRWAKLLSPIAHRVARRFELAGAAGIESLQHISRSGNVETENVRLSPWLDPRRPDWKAPVKEAGDKRRCRRCGATISEKRRVYCEDCIVTLPRMATAYAVQALKRRQREERGAGPTQETRDLMGDARTQRAKAIRAWEAEHPSIPSSHVFANDIFPTLAHLRAPQLRAVTGLCRSYCSRILRGQYIPHPMHWDAIRRLARGTVTPSAIRR